MHKATRDKTIYMAKRNTTLSPKKKSRRSHKTKKRLAIKKEMLAKKANRGKRVAVKKIATKKVAK